ncbi:MAG: polyhydroxyalkanoate synthesis regulator DNA-binding domain-containing protein [Polyangiales bacterium]
MDASGVGTMPEETKEQDARGAAATDEAELPVRTIKRYANRKLYDTSDSRYVTLHQIAEFVRQGEDIRIIDNKTKEDLTNVTLAQIIYEEQKNADATQASSVRSLRSFIQQSRERLMHSLRDGPMGKLVSRREDEEGLEGVDSEGGGEQGLGSDHAEVGGVDPTEDAPETPRRSAKETFDELGRLADDRVKSVVAAAMSHVQQLQNEVKRLQSRIEELEERLKGRGKKDEAGGSGEAGDDPAEQR